MTTERMTELTQEIDALTIERYEIGKSLPPVTVNEVKDDHVFVESVREWMRMWMPSIDTTLLDRDNFEKWELLTPRYEVRETDEGWGVWDFDEAAFLTDEDDGKVIEYGTEREADDFCYERECEQADARYAFPFAWNTGWVLEGKHWLAELRETGFLVYEYDNDAIIAGIDGGGYAFMDAHFIPLYAALAEKNGWLVETTNGPRYITTKTKE